MRTGPVVVVSCVGFAGVPRRMTPLPGFATGFRLCPTSVMAPLPVEIVALFTSMATGVPVPVSAKLVVAGVSP